MNVENLPKKIYDKCVALNVKYLVLKFSGGDDEGFLDIDLITDGPSITESNLEEDIVNWAWTVYRYNGAGDGNSYGDNITYNIEERTATTVYWHMVEKYNNPIQHKFELI